MKMPQNITTHLALLLCNFIWALDFPLYKIVLPHYVTPLAMTTSAVVVAALVTLIISLFVPWERVDGRDAVKFILAGLFIGVGRKIFLMEGMARTSPIDGSIIGTMTPLVVLVVSVLLHLDRFTPMKILGLALGMAGALVIIVSGSAPSHEASTLLGNMLIVLCVVSSALYMTWFKSLITKYRVATVMRWLYCSAAIALLPVGFESIVNTNYAALQGNVLWAYLFILLMPTVGPNFLLIYSLGKLPPTVTSIYAYLQPVVATTVAVMMHLDRLTLESGIAASIIFLGVFFVVRSYHNSHQAPLVRVQ